MKTIATMILGMCVLAAASPSAKQTPELLLQPADVSASDNSSPCMSKKISGKIPVVPRMKCRFS